MGVHRRDNGVSASSWSQGLSLPGPGRVPESPVQTTQGIPLWPWQWLGRRIAVWEAGLHPRPASALPPQGPQSPRPRQKPHGGGWAKWPNLAQQRGQCSKTPASPSGQRAFKQGTGLPEKPQKGIARNTRATSSRPTPDPSRVSSPSSLGRAVLGRPWDPTQAWPEGSRVDVSVEEA